MTSVYSMTGYGEAEAATSALSVAIEIRAVNHRYLEMSVRIPASFSAYEEIVKTAIKKHISRGKLDIKVNVKLTDDELSVMHVDMGAAKSYLAAGERLKNELALPGEIDLALLTQMPGVLSQGKLALDHEQTSKLFSDVASEAARALNEARADEGLRLAEDVLSHAKRISTLVDIVADKEPLLSEIYAQKLHKRISEILDTQLDKAIYEARIALEVAILADKSCVSEEIARLRSHIHALEQMLAPQGAQDEPASGKKLDFIVQEMNREANTIGSKANELEITDVVIELKSEIEKIREQVQNIS